VALGALAAFAALACPQSEPKREAPVAKAPERAPFEVSASIAQPVAPGARGELTATLVTRDGFKVNPDYPLNFRPEGGTANVKFERARFDLQDAVEKAPCATKPADACEARARIPFTAAEAGPARASGVLAFSVCNPDKCLIEKVSISAEASIR
jgi:hypothetical protein